MALIQASNFGSEKSDKTNWWSRNGVRLVIECFIFTFITWFYIIYSYDALEDASRNIRLAFPIFMGMGYVISRHCDVLIYFDQRYREYMKLGSRLPKR